MAGSNVSNSQHKGVVPLKNSSVFREISSPAAGVVHRQNLYQDNHPFQQIPEASNSALRQNRPASHSLHQQMWQPSQSGPSYSQVQQMPCPSQRVYPVQPHQGELSGRYYRLEQNQHDAVHFSPQQSLPTPHLVPQVVSSPTQSVIPGASSFPIQGRQISLHPINNQASKAPPPLHVQNEEVYNFPQESGQRANLGLQPSHHEQTLMSQQPERTVLASADNSLYDSWSSMFTPTPRVLQGLSLPPATQRSTSPLLTGVTYLLSPEQVRAYMNFIENNIIF